MPFPLAFGACATHVGLSFEEAFLNSIVHVKINKEEWMILRQKRKLKGRK